VRFFYTVPPKAQHVLASALFGKIVKDIKVNFQLTTRHKIVFVCLQVCPYLGFSSSYHNRWIIPSNVPNKLSHYPQISRDDSLFLIDEVCSVCRTRFREHEVHSRELPDHKYSQEYM
jgi:hypothetical protein